MIQVDQATATGAFRPSVEMDTGGLKMSLSYDFAGQVALVTGASAGIGLATAKAFAYAGAAVVLADVNEAALEMVTSELRRVGLRALAVKCDVSDESQAAAMVERAVAEFGRLDMAFNNAGIAGPSGPFLEETAEQFDQVNAVNLRGVWTCTKHELKQMRAQSNGAIVNCSSLGGLVGQRDVQRITPRSSESSDSQKALPWNTRLWASASTQSAPVSSRRRCLRL